MVRLNYYPTVVFLDPKGKEVSRHIGYLGAEDMMNEIKQSRGKLPKETPGFEIIYAVPVFMLLLFKKKAATRTS